MNRKCVFKSYPQYCYIHKFDHSNWQIEKIRSARLVKNFVKKITFLFANFRNKSCFQGLQGNSDND